MVHPPLWHPLNMSSHSLLTIGPLIQILIGLHILGETFHLGGHLSLLSLSSVTLLALMFTFA